MRTWRRGCAPDCPGRGLPHQTAPQTRAHTQRGEGQVTPRCLCSSSPEPSAGEACPRDLGPHEATSPGSAGSFLLLVSSQPVSGSPSESQVSAALSPYSQWKSPRSSERIQNSLFFIQSGSRKRLRSGLGLSQPFRQPQSRLPESRHGLLCEVTYVGDKNLTATPPLCQLMLSHCSWPGGALGAGIGGEQ